MKDIVAFALPKCYFLFCFEFVLLFFRYTMALKRSSYAQELEPVMIWKMALATAASLCGTAVRRGANPLNDDALEPR